MYGKLYSACIYGIDGILIEVEVDLANGIPQTTVVGLPDSAVREAVERVRAAIKNCGFSFPLQRVTINLAPADLRKEGSAFDLAIALGLLTASGQVTLPENDHLLIIGELSLDGTVRPVPGVLSMVDLALRHGFHAVLVSADNAEEAALLDGIKVYSLRHLGDLTSKSPEQEELVEKPLQINLKSLEYHQSSTTFPHKQSEHPSLKKIKLLEPDHQYPQQKTQEDYRDVFGQRHIKRALTIAAAGMHNIIPTVYYESSIPKARISLKQRIKNLQIHWI